MKTSTPTTFVTHRKVDDPHDAFTDKHMLASDRPEANKALPTHPITIPGRYKVMVSKLYPEGNPVYVPGKEYNVDAATKKALEDAQVLRVSSAA